MMRRPLILAALFAGLHLPVQAQDADRAERQCELHIFPLMGIHVNDVTQNSMGGILPALINQAFAISRPEEIAAFLRETVSREQEAQVLGAIDYAATRKGAGARVVVHPEPYQGDAVTVPNYRSSPPVVANPAPCHRELILMTFYYEKGTMSQSLKTTYVYREFQDGQPSRRARLAVEASGISDFPPDDADELAAAREAVRDGYLANIMEMLNRR